MATRHFSFASIAKLHDNNKETTSVLGELSNKTRTYEKDPAVFSITGPSETILYNFQSFNDTTKTTITQALASKEIEIANWLYAQAVGGFITSSPTACLQLLRAQFSNGVEIASVGVMVTNSVIYLPSFIQGFHIVGSEREEFKLWFANEYFETGYPFRTFAISHPVVLADFDYLVENNYVKVAERLALETPDVVEQRVKGLTNNGKYPYTDRVVFEFEIFDLLNAGRKVKAYWIAIIWGNPADSEELILNQIREEILAISKHDEAYLSPRIPDLFNPLEFTGIPNWNRLGLVNRTTQTSLLSPATDYETALEWPILYLDGITEAHIIKSLQVVPFQYLSAAVGFVAKVSNRDGIIKLIDHVYKDYQLIPSTDSQFGLMDPDTRKFVLDMEILLEAARKMTPDSIPPANVQRIERNGHLYAMKKSGKVNLVILTHYQFVKDGHING